LSNGKFSKWTVLFREYIEFSGFFLQRCHARVTRDSNFKHNYCTRPLLALLSGHAARTVLVGRASIRFVATLVNTCIPQPTEVLQCIYRHRRGKHRLLMLATLTPLEQVGFSRASENDPVSTPPLSFTRSLSPFSITSAVPIL